MKLIKDFRIGTIPEIKSDFEEDMNDSLGEKCSRIKNEIIKLWNRFRTDFDMSQIFLRSLEEWMGQRDIQHRYSCKIFQKFHDSNASFCKKESDFKAFSLFEKKINDLGSNLSIINSESHNDSSKMEQESRSRFSRIINKLKKPQKHRKKRPKAAAKSEQMYRNDPSHLNANSDLSDSHFDSKLYPRTKLFATSGLGFPHYQQIQKMNRSTDDRAQLFGNILETGNWISQTASQGKFTDTTGPTHYIKSQIKMNPFSSKIINPNAIHSFQTRSQRDLTSNTRFNDHPIPFERKLTNKIFSNLSVQAEGNPSLFSRSHPNLNLNRKYVPPASSVGQITPNRVWSITSKTTDYKKENSSSKQNELTSINDSQNQSNLTFKKKKRNRKKRKNYNARNKRKESYLIIKDFQTPQYSKKDFVESRKATNKYSDEFSKSPSIVGPLNLGSLDPFEENQDIERFFPVFGMKPSKKIRVLSENYCSQITPSQDGKKEKYIKRSVNRVKRPISNAAEGEK